MTTSLARERAPRPQPDQPAAYTAPGLTLRSALGIFMQYVNSKLIAGMLIAAIAVRIALGGWGWGDLVVSAFILGVQRFTEWIIHVTILHLRPFTVRGRTLDLYIAKRHRAHHADPKVIKHVLIPRGVVVRLLIFSAPLYWLVTPTLREG